MPESKNHIVCSTAEPGATRRAVLLFARAPLNEARAKRVAGLEIPARLKLFGALTLQAVRSAVGSGCDLVVAADAPAPVFRRNAAHLLRQRGAGFGERLLNAVRDTFALGYDQVAVMGNDSPELDGNAIREAMECFAPGTFTLCRAADGGFTLLLLDRTIIPSLAAIFSPSRWETSFLFDDLADAARRENIPVEEREGGADLDTLRDLMRLAGCAAAPRELCELAAQFLSPRQFFPLFLPFIRTLCRTLRICPQKAPPSLLLHPAL